MRYTTQVTILLRNLSPDVQRAIEGIRGREGISVEAAAIRLLEASVVKPSTTSGFEEFCGAWSRDEADRFDVTLREMRTVDPADWELRG